MITWESARNWFKPASQKKASPRPLVSANTAWERNSLRTVPSLAFDTSSTVHRLSHERRLKQKLYNRSVYRSWPRPRVGDVVRNDTRPPRWPIHSFPKRKGRNGRSLLLFLPPPLFVQQRSQTPHKFPTLLFSKNGLIDKRYEHASIDEGPFQFAWVNFGPGAHFSSPAVFFPGRGRRRGRGRGGAEERGEERGGN